MDADLVEVSWDPQKDKWLVRIVVGAEVIRRYCDEGKQVAESALRSMAAKTAADEGYTVRESDVVIR